MLLDSGDIGSVRKGRNDTAKLDFTRSVTGFADMDVQANYMLAPQYIGIATMLVGAALGFFGMKKA